MVTKDLELPVTLMLDELEISWNKPLGAARARRLATRNKLSWKIYGLLQPDCPNDVLVAHQGHSCWQVRLVVAVHPATPTWVRIRLLRDPVEWVRVASRQKLGVALR